MPGATQPLNTNNINISVTISKPCFLNKDPQDFSPNMKSHSKQCHLYSLIQIYYLFGLLQFAGCFLLAIWVKHLSDTAALQENAVSCCNCFADSAEMCHCVLSLQKRSYPGPEVKVVLSCVSQGLSPHVVQVF